MNVNVQLDKGAYMPKREHATDAGADLRTPKSFEMLPRTSHIVHTGVHVEIPPGHAVIVMSKSGLYMKYGIIVTGLIDEGYTGEIVVKLFNLGPLPVHFLKGDKIAQMVITNVEYAGFNHVDEITGGERGDDGFGSTGR